VSSSFSLSVQDNDLLHDIFDIKIDHTEIMSTTEKVCFSQLGWPCLLI